MTSRVVRAEVAYPIILQGSSGVGWRAVNHPALGWDNGKLASGDGFKGEIITVINLDNNITQPK